MRALIAVEASVNKRCLLRWRHAFKEEINEQTKMSDLPEDMTCHMPYVPR